MMDRAARRILLVVSTSLAVVGAAPVAAQARVLKVTGKQTTITLSSQAAAFLSAHHVTVAPVSPATISGESLTLPITGGFLTHKLNGKVTHAGGVQFTNGTKTVTLSAFTLAHHGRRTVLSAQAGSRHLKLARVTQVHIVVSHKQGTLTGELRLTQTAAAAINKLAGQKVVSAGADLGSITSTVMTG